MQVETNSQHQMEGPTIEDMYVILKTAAPAAM